MFYVSPRTPEQQERWDAFTDGLRALERETRDSEDPWLFHGTGAIAAAWIRREGFRPSNLQVRPEGEPGTPDATAYLKGVNWGSVNVACWAALKSSRSDDPPVILAARLSDLRRAGTLVPDHAAWETGCSASRGPYDDRRPSQGDLPSHPDWKQSLAIAGAIGVEGCRRVDSMVFHHPLRDMPVHPSWEEARAFRRSGDSPGMPLPPRGMAEATPRSNPPTRTWTECFEWSQKYEEALLNSMLEPTDVIEVAAPAP
jgi:hypothetical protein